MKNKINNLILELNSACNNNCIYCYIPEKFRNLRQISDQSEYFKNKLRNFRKRNIVNVDFTGGEPTLYKGLTDLVRYSREIGYKNRTLVTNGRLLAYKGYCSKLAEAGITRVVIPLDGPNKRITEAITRTPGSFEQTLRAIKNIKEANIELGVTIVINKLNYKYARETIKKSIDLGADFINIQFLLPYVHDKEVICKRVPSNIIPSYEESAKYVKRALDIYGGQKKINVHFIPFCYMGGYEKYLAEEAIKSDRQVVNYMGYSYNMGKHLQKGAVKVKKCKSCNYKKKCAGFLFPYFNELGIKELGSYVYNPTPFSATNKERVHKLKNFIGLFKTSKNAKAALDVVFSNSKLRFQTIDFCFGIKDKKKHLKMSVEEIFEKDEFIRNLLKITKILKANRRIVKNLVSVSVKNKLKMVYSIRDDEKQGIKIYFDIPKNFDAAPMLSTICKKTGEAAKESPLDMKSIRLVGFEVGKDLLSVTIYELFESIGQTGVNDRIPNFSSLFSNIRGLEFMVGSKFDKSGRCVSDKLYVLPGDLFNKSTAFKLKQITNSFGIDNSVKKIFQLFPCSRIAAFAFNLNNKQKDIYIIP